MAAADSELAARVEAKAARLVKLRSGNATVAEERASVTSRSMPGLPAGGSPRARRDAALFSYRLARRSWVASWTLAAAC